MVKDYKNTVGLWAMTAMVDGKQVLTESGEKWSKIIKRTKINGSYQREKPSYIGCTNNFEDFQSFVEWHVNQVGYGCGYHLDKDILQKGNKSYSEETCSLVPAKINTLLLKREARRGSCAIGVYRSGNKFRACCSDGDGHNKSLGSFVTEFAAFVAYKTYKEYIINKIANDFQGQISEAVYKALLSYKVEVTD